MSGYLENLGGGWRVQGCWDETVAEGGLRSMVARRKTNEDAAIIRQEMR